MIPLAEQLNAMGHNIIIGSGEEHLALFRAELPGFSFINFSGFKPGYSSFLPQYISLLVKTPILLYHIIMEHFRLKKTIKENNIDIVISDNRFGLWNRNITSVYVTHMPRIPFPKPLRFLEFFGILLHRSIIKKYSLCFIPDLPGDLNLSGRLSHDIKLPDNVRYIGILSRFSKTELLQQENNQKFRHNTVILSGPEPQREMLKQKLVNIFKDHEPTTVILEGRPDSKKESVRSGNILFCNHLPVAEMKEMITESESIVTRSGYTTIMEMVSLNCSALLIPTPGQTEQEYLAEYLSEKGWFSSVSQGGLKEGISFPHKNAKWSNDIVKQSSILLTNTLQEMLEKHHKKD
jgi:hypothetical protein